MTHDANRIVAQADRMLPLIEAHCTVLHCVEAAFGRPVPVGKVQSLLPDTAERLNAKHSNPTPRLLDH